jgi:maltose phosphorylase
MCTLYTSGLIEQDGCIPLLKNIRLDDYNKEVEEGCHITSMLEQMSIVEGFLGMRVKNDTLHFSQKSKRMEGYSFKINFRGQIIK